MFKRSSGSVRPSGALHLIVSRGPDCATRFGPCVAHLGAKEHGDLKTIMNGTFSLIDRAARKGYIKSGTAARYKSRIHKRVKVALGDVAK